MIARELLPGLDILPSFDWTDQTLVHIRSGASIAAMTPPPLSPEQQSVRCEPRFIPGPSGAPNVRVLIYTPAVQTRESRPAYLHIHGGGYILGVPELNDGMNRDTVLEQGCSIVSVDYRLAPETRFPGALEDCYAALVWLHKNAEQLGIDRTRIAIGGESAGGGHAAALAILARKRGEVPICFQFLDAPMTDDRTGAVSDPYPYCGEFVWTPASNRYGWRALLGVEPGGPDVPVDAVPARTLDLSGLPSTCIVVSALDLFLEENVEYARRLIRAGVATELHVIPGAYHGFGVGSADAPQVQAPMRLRRDALARAFRKDL